MNPIASLDDSVRARIGHDIGDFADRIWTNAFGTAPLGKPEPAPRLGPSGERRLSQERDHD